MFQQRAPIYIELGKVSTISLAFSVSGFWILSKLPVDTKYYHSSLFFSEHMTCIPCFTLQVGKHFVMVIVF